MKKLEYKVLTTVITFIAIITFFTGCSPLDELDKTVIHDFTNHDITILRFTEGERISAFVDFTPVNLRGRNIYTISRCCHDAAFVPLEPLFDIAGVDFKWDKYNSILYIKDFDAKITISDLAGPRRFPPAHILSVPVPYFDYFNSEWVFIEERDSGLYVDAEWLSFLARQESDVFGLV